MGFYDSDVYDSWAGTGEDDGYDPEKEDIELIDIVKVIAEKGAIDLSSKQEIFFAMLVASKVFYQDNLTPYLIRKGELKESSFGCVYSESHTGIKRIDYKNKKAIGSTYSGGYLSRHRKYWDYECPIKYVYVNVQAPLTLQCEGIYISLDGTEAVVINPETGRVISRHRVSIDEAICLLVENYNKCKRSKWDAKCFMKTWVEKIFLRLKGELI